MNNSRITFNVLYYIKKAVTLRDGQNPIYCRITVNGSRTEFSVNRTIDENNWSQRANKSIGKDQTSKTLNQYLEQLRVKIYNTQADLAQKQEPLTATRIKNKLFGLDERPLMLLEMYDEHNEKLARSIDHGISKSTHTRHCTTRSHLSLFINMKYGITDITIRDINNAFIQDFDHYLRVDRKCNNNSSVKYQKNFKKIIKYALDNGWIAKDPFIGIRYRFEKTNKPYLTTEELDRLILKLFEIQRLSIVRDVFVFCSYTGLSFVDVKSLRYSDLKHEPNGSTWIEKPRQKTKVMSEIPLLPKARELVEKYKIHEDKSDAALVFPVSSNQKMNAYLKEIAILCNINKVLTTHVARHTFATTIAMGNNIPIEVIAKILGHSSTKETRIYAVVEKQLIGKAMGKLMHPVGVN
ncbi:MAG: site-specific integrase [Chitinophagaceae bacterium]|nr:site-specific integrase [Chitinophagaceae bacterium]